MIQSKGCSLRRAVGQVAFLRFLFAARNSKAKAGGLQASWKREGLIGRHVFATWELKHASDNNGNVQSLQRCRSLGRSAAANDDATQAT